LPASPCQFARSRHLSQLLAVLVGAGGLRYAVKYEAETLQQVNQDLEKQVQDRDCPFKTARNNNRLCWRRFPIYYYDFS
jgi:hypothetical protein